jgi:fructose-1,6-bisphosphatase I
VQRAGTQGLFALGGETNVQGEDQKKLDVLANDVMINALIGSKKVARLDRVAHCRCRCLSARRTRTPW